MTFQDSIRAVLSKYATFAGRAGRSELWWWYLAVLVAVTVTTFLDGLLFGPDTGVISALLSLAVFAPNIAVSVRRLHDTDRSGWWILIGLVPVVGFLVLIWFYIQPGTEGANRFG